MKTIRSEVQLQGQLGQLKRDANLSAICNNGSSTVSARKMRRIEKSLARKNKKSYTVSNA